MCRKSLCHKRQPNSSGTTRHFVKEVYRKGEKELEHADPTYGFKTSSSKHTQEERFGMLMEYLREYTFITRQEYPVSYIL